MTRPEAVQQTDRVDGSAILEGIGPLPAPSATPALVMLVGLPGSGKSTLAQRLAPVLNAAVLESDELRRRFFRQPSHSYPESRVLFRAIHDAATRLLKQGVSVILDATNLKESDRKPVEEIAQAAGVSLTVVYVTAPEQVIASRLTAREAATSGGGTYLAGFDIYDRMRRTMQPPEDACCLRIDTGDEVFYEAAVRQIIQTVTGKVKRDGPGTGVAVSGVGEASILKRDEGLSGGSWGGRS